MAIAPSAKFQKSRPVICGFSYRIKRLFWISYLAFWLTCFCTLFFLFTIYAIKFNGHRHRVSPFRIQFSRLHGCRPSILRFIWHVVALGQIFRNKLSIRKTYSMNSEKLCQHMPGYPKVAAYSNSISHEPEFSKDFEKCKSLCP